MHQPDSDREASASDVLGMSNITKSFSGTVVLDDVSFRLKTGTIHALLGENGAGKTTLMRIAFGLYSADRGETTAGTPPRAIHSPIDAIASGLGMVHQHFTNVPAMTVVENVALGGTGRFEQAAVASAINAIGERTGLRLDPAALAGSLSVAGQQRLEIVKSLAQGARALLLDEPTAVLAPTEAAELLEWLRRFADAGNAAVLITHRLDEALRVADRITVLRRGRLVLSAPAESLDRIRLSEAMIGESGGTASSPPVPSSDAGGASVARLEGATVRDESGVDCLIDVTLSVARGEILGIAALDGNGQRELLRVLSGRIQVSRGNVSVPDRVGFVPEDRQRDALILDESLTVNAALNGSGSRRGIIRWGQYRERARGIIAAYDVRGGTPETPARALSGGNQQKFALGRELDASPEMIVVENPTRGLDIRASAAVHARLRHAAERGTAVVIYSQDLDELLALATRIVVVHRGRARSVPTDRAIIGRAMLGVA
jgi:general nucleoside transport system ATP-binding protein